MEKRFYWGTGILALLLILSILGAVCMKSIHHPGEEDLQAAAELALTENVSEAIALAEKARENWNRWRPFTAALADHTPMDETENRFAEMEVFAAAEESVHFSACCLELSNMLKAMYDAHCFTLWNIL